MLYERETIQRIRSEVDRYDKYQQLGKEETIGTPSDTPEPRVTLCSEVRRSLTVSAYGVILSEDLGIEDFVTPLLNLLQDRIGSNARFNRVSFWFNLCFHVTNLVGENVLLLPSLLCMPRDWWSTEGDISCHLHMAEQWPSL